MNGGRFLPGKVVSLPFGCLSFFFGRCHIHWTLFTPWHYLFEQKLAHIHQSTRFLFGQSSKFIHFLTFRDFYRSPSIFEWIIYANSVSRTTFVVDMLSIDVTESAPSQITVDNFCWKNKKKMVIKNKFTLIANTNTETTKIHWN